MEARLMKFTVGYQYPDDPDSERFPEILADYREDIAELFFSYGDEPGARAPAAASSGWTPAEAKKILTEDLKSAAFMGIRLNLLFNANCHGRESVGKQLRERVLRTISELSAETPLDSVTTASFFIAELVKKNFPVLKVRASVNMKLGTIEAMEYAEDLFDGFCVQRDFNYQPEKLHAISTWAKQHHKQLCLLANSGCLRNCAAQIFHDNLVAHIGELKREECCMDFNPVFCRTFYANPEHRTEYLAHSVLIRPEDLHHYEADFPLVKLATRTHCNPRLVLEAYTSRHFTGNFFDLSEPGHGIFFRGKILDNAKIPPDYWLKKSKCKENCKECGFCKNIMEQALLNCPELQ